MKFNLTERGWAGHFCGAAKCRFHRNTLIEVEEEKIVVSTVGAYFPRSGEPAETLGIGRYYETMAFRAIKIDKYWDADVSDEIYFDSPWVVNKLEDDDVANEQHDAVVQELLGKLIVKYEARENRSNPTK